MGEIRRSPRRGVVASRPGVAKPQREYDEAFWRTLDFVEKYQAAPKGSWWATRAADGSPQGQTRTSPWQGAYHNGRAMLRCIKLLEERAEKIGAGEGKH